MIEIEIKRAKLTKSQFAQLPVASAGIITSRNASAVGYFRNIKHPRIKECLIVLLKRENQYYVQGYWPKMQLEDVVIRIGEKALCFETKEEAKEYYIRYLSLTKDIGQLFI